MWSLRQTLATLGAYPPSGYNHLPNGFDPANGIRSLFPRNQTLGISVLSDYVFYLNGTTYTSAGDTGQILVIADGAGRWGVGAVGDLDSQAISWAAGFVFNYSNDGDGHGYIIDNANTNAGIVNGFGDPWILQNWPQAFPAGAYLWMWVEITSFKWAFSKGSHAPVSEAAKAANSSFGTLQEFSPSNSRQLPQSTDIAPGDNQVEDPVTNELGNQLGDDPEAYGYGGEPNPNYPNPPPPPPPNYD